MAGEEVSFPRSMLRALALVGIAAAVAGWLVVALLDGYGAVGWLADLVFTALGLLGAWTLVIMRRRSRG